jgi:HPt (histidine-containing phosphotransfer) domain-containing protein
LDYLTSDRYADHNKLKLGKRVDNVPLKILLTQLDAGSELPAVQSKLQSVGYHTYVALTLDESVQQALSYEYDALMFLSKNADHQIHEAVQLLRQLGYQRPISVLAAQEGRFEQVDQHFSWPCQWELLYGWFNGLTRQNLKKLDVPDELQQLFAESLAVAAAELELAMQNDDLLKIKQIVHRLKGNAACFGEAQITGLANELQLLWEEQKVPVRYEQLTALLVALKTGTT